MSIKKLFESTNKVQEFVSNTNVKNLYDGDVESYENVDAKTEDQKRYVPEIDYSKPENFAKYGSAQLYYRSALTRITDFYPYDGSEAEKNQFLNGCLDIERYILDNQYPRTTGYIELGRTYAVSSVSSDGYGVPTANEYIDFLGGPGTGSAPTLNLKDLMPNPKDNKYNYSNIYDESIYATAKLPTDYGKGSRTSNLKSNFDDGVTVEFWMKTGSITPSVTSKQVIFDLWNQVTSSDNGNGRLVVELTSSHGASGDALRPFIVTVQSGAHTTKDFLSLGKAVLHSSSGDWNHYAIRIFNTGSILKTQLYVNGQLNDTALRQPYDLASNTIGLLSNAYKTTFGDQQRSWPNAIEAGYSSAANLQGWWRLNNSSSLNRFDDMSGHGRHGQSDSVSSTPTIDTTNYPNVYIQGTTGSMDFDGTAVAGDDHIDIGTADTWDALIGNAAGSPQQMTLAAWIRPQGLGENNYGRILDFGNGDIQLRMTSAGTGNNVYFSTRRSVDNGQWYTNYGSITFDQWVHVVVTYDANSTGNNPVFYINGVAKTVGAGTVTEGKAPNGSNAGITTEKCFIGNRNNPGSDKDRTFAGQIADVAIWNSILSANEVKAIYNATLIKTTTHTVGELGPKNLKARIGALQASHYAGPANAGRLSGSLDEFRFWKAARTSKEIGTNWFTQVRGGSNSDISNTTLGVYYKFNEGITGVSTTDSVVLDYAGRVTNGRWTGYASGARNTGSAIVLASAANKEFLDPIIRTNHPDYISLESGLLESGSAHDYQNSTAFLKLVPSWILDDVDETDNTDLRYITHTMGAYFDKLHAQIKDPPRLSHQTHTSGTFSPISFAEHLPQSLGLYSPEIFIDATVSEKFMNHSEQLVYENDFAEAKNLIYQNLYNNLTEIYKAKGTEQAIRNVLKCFNVNDNLLALKINSNNSEFILKNNLEQHLLSKNCINFNTRPNSDAVIYQMNKPYTGVPSGDISGFVTGSTAQYGYGFTLESNIIFPYYNSLLTKNNRLSPEYNQVSLFGTVTVDGTDNASKLGTDTSAVSSGEDYGNFKVYFVRDAVESRAGYFKLVFAKPGSSPVTLTSSVFNEVYNNEAWNLSVRVKPSNYPLTAFVSDDPSEASSAKKNRYNVIFSGFNAKTTDLFDSFSVSTNVGPKIGKNFIESAKRVYVGADRVNVTGDVSYKSDVLA